MSLIDGVSYGFPGFVNEVMRLWRGDTKQIRVEFYSDRANTVPLDMTPLGDNWNAQLDVAPDDLAVIFLVDSSLASSGIITLTLDSVSTAELVQRLYYFELYVEDDSIPPVRSTVLTGQIMAEGDYAQ